MTSKYRKIRYETSQKYGYAVVVRNKRNKKRRRIERMPYSCRSYYGVVSYFTHVAYHDVLWLRNVKKGKQVKK